MKDKVLAVVDNRQVTEAHMAHLKQTIGPERMQQFQGENGQAQLLQELINQELFYSYAMEQGYDKEEAFLQEVEIVKANLLKSYAIRQFLNNVEFDNTKAQAYYDENADQFVKAPTVSASHILVKEEADAKRIKAELDGGKDFADAAKEHSTCPSKERGGDLGSFGRGQMVPEFEQAAFDSEINVVTDPVKTQFGYHLIKVSEKQPESKQRFEDVKSQIEKHLMHQAQNAAYFDKIAGLKEKYTVKIEEE